MLQSQLFRDDPALQACAAQDAAHLKPGSGGEPVGRIQLALLALSAPAVNLDELRAARYGPSTAASVLAYKQRRAIVNRSYQQQADNIVGRLTVMQMDRELLALERCCPPTPGRLDPLLDSAPAFALRVSLVHALAAAAASQRPDRWAIAAAPGSAASPEAGPGEVVMQASASAVRHVLRSLVTVRHGTRQPVSAEPGLLRQTLCQTATQAPVLGKRFDEAPVSSCWNRVRRADDRRQPAPEESPRVRTAWCGIFATWLWWLAGQDVVWVGGVGPSHAASGRRLRTSTLLPMLAPGDIIVEHFGHIHHMLVLSIAADRSTAEIIEGNAGDAPAHLTTVKRRSLKLPKDGAHHWFYSVDTLRSPAISYGYNAPEATARGA